MCAEINELILTQSLQSLTFDLWLRNQMQTNDSVVYGIKSDQN